MKKPNNVEEIYIDDIHEYNYVKAETKDECVHTLYYSDWYGWADTIKGKKAIELIDSGNGVTIKDLSLDDEQDYLRIEQLHIMLRLHSQQCTYQIAQPSLKKDF